MPELPEVETTARGIRPHLAGAVVREVIVRNGRLRQPVSASLADCGGRRIVGVERRAKYILCPLDDGSHWLIHLGMSGSLRIVEPGHPFKTHDHVAITLSPSLQLRLHDPRRFGLFLHLPPGDPHQHPLLADLGPEPLSDEFTPASLAAAVRTRTSPIKTAIMDAHVVVGVGNIYASEALFLAGIRPQAAAASLSRPKLVRLHAAIRTVISRAIAQGGTTLRDFLHTDGSPGYFAQSLRVYGRTGQPCHTCQSPIRQKTLGQRSTFWCPTCQR